jgi:hypothetical protein
VPAKVRYPSGLSLTTKQGEEIVAGFARVTAEKM